jgi:hypothetical protein
MYTETVHLVHGMWIIKYLLICLGGWAAVAITHSVTRRYVKDTWKDYSFSPNYRKRVPNPVPGTLQRLGLALTPAGLTIAIAVSIMMSVSGGLHRVDTLIVLLSLMLPTVWFSISCFFQDVEQKRKEETSEAAAAKEQETPTEGLTA